MFKFLLGLMFFATAAFGAPKRLVLNSSNSVLLLDQISALSASQIIQELADKDALLPPGQPLYLVLASPGGDVEAGLALIEGLKGLGRPVHTISVTAASMAFQTAQALGKRYILESGELMSHRARGGVSGQIPGEANSRLEYWTKRVTRLDKQVAARAGYSLQDYRLLIQNEFWCEGQDCVDSGFADAVVVVSCDSTTNGTYVKTIKDSFLGMPILFKLTMSKCPVRTMPIDFDVEITGKSLFKEKPANLSDKEVGLILDYAQKKVYMEEKFKKRK